MIKKLLSKTKFEENDFIKELLNPTFDPIKTEKIQKELNIDLNGLYVYGEFILHICCKKGLLKAVVWLINNSIDIEKENEFGQTAIFYAIQSKNSGVLQILVENKANINHLDKYKRTALQDAVISANNRIIDYLIDKTDILHNCDIHGNNLIFDALANGSLDVIKKIGLLKKDININQINEDGNCILHKEIVQRDNTLALLLMELGADPTILDKSGKNFLFYAVSKGILNLDIINKAVELGCDINSRCKGNTTILMESINYYLNTPKEEKEIKENHLEMIKELIAKGVKINALNEKEETVFFDATRSEELELIEIFIEHQLIDINHENINGESVLRILVLNGIRNIDLIKLYLEHGANPDQKNKFGISIIEMLIEIILHSENRKEIDFDLEIQLNEDAEYATVLENILKNTKINLNQLNSKGEPLFFDAIIHFNFKLFKLLRNTTFNINQKDREGNNIVFKLMDYYSQHTIKDKKIYLGTLQSLINIGVDINIKNKEGLTPLHKAVSEKCEYTVKLLLENKADCFAKDPKGRSVIHNCIWKDTTRYFRLLHSYNSEIINIPDSFGVRPINYAAFMGKKDLVIEMLDAGALVNNPNKKDPKILQFFLKFHKNILNITKNVENNIDKTNLGLLADSMIKEFNIKRESE